MGCSEAHSQLQEEGQSGGLPGGGDTCSKVGGNGPAGMTGQGAWTGAVGGSRSMKAQSWAAFFGGPGFFSCGRIKAFSM